MRDEDIDTVDVSELPPENWARSKRALQRKEGDQVVTMHLAPDVAHWLERTTQNNDYAAAINRLLREHITGR